MPLPSANRTDLINQTSWASGMITTLPPEELPDDAAVLIENFEFDDIGNLSTRLSPILLVDTTLGSSIYGFYTAHFSDGTIKIVFAVDNNDVNTSPDLYWMNADGSSITLLASNIATPGQRIYFTMFNDVVIVTSNSGSSDGIGSAIRSIDSAGTVTNLFSSSSAPLSTQAIVWNNRLWTFGDGSGSDNILKASAINDETDWVVDDDAGAIELGVEISDGDRINALSIFKGALIVYKFNKIYIVSAISAPATIPSNLRVDLFTDKFGCIQRGTIQNLLDDQVFLSNAGITSLSLSPLGETTGAILSRNISELGEIKLGTFIGQDSLSSSCTSINIKHKQQYWIYVPAALGNGTNTVWVMDYSDIQKRDSFGFPLIRWCKFTGNIVSYSYAEYTRTSNAYLLVLVDGIDNDIVWLYDPLTNPTTFTGTHTRRLITRAFGQSKIRSLWHRFCTTLTKLTTNVSYTVNYYYDNFITSSAGSYTKSLTGTPANNNRTIWNSFKKNDSGRKANLVQLEITANTTDQGFTIKSISLETTSLNHKQATTKWNSD
jgi:hypothetical protein